MILPVSVGKSSANEDYIVDLTTLPHLFIAYSYPDQLQYLFNHLMATLISGNNKSPAVFDVSFSKRLLDSLDENISAYIRNRFIVKEVDETNTGSKSEFLKSLNKEMNRRLKLLNDRGVKEINELNERNKQPLPYIVVCIEDVFSIAISNKKSTGLIFVQLILSGPSVGIHFIAATTSSYRNLLTQLVNIRPTILKELKTKDSNQNLKVMPPFGAELVITPDELYFIKEREMMVHERFFRV